ncbi:MAG: hypothetical protein ACAF41_12035 [Leptolyngbya sp. BL-A-14]
MKLLRRLITLSLFASLLAASRAASLPVEPDYPCYMKNVSGRIIDLTQKLCRASEKATQATTSTTTASVTERPSSNDTDATSSADDVESNSNEAGE